MAENSTSRPITIDLSQFKLHINLKKRIELTLHFNSPSRRFYLSVIALVVNSMKRSGKIAPVPLQQYQDELTLLNETIGGSAGSSGRENLLPRIYRKWQYALPNLEEAPLFRVLGRTKGYNDGVGKGYSFTDDEKDVWANLFEYKGSEENVRLKFAVDKIGVSLDDVTILYDGFVNGDAWERFLSGLKEIAEKAPGPQPLEPIVEATETPPPIPDRRRCAWHRRHYRVLVPVALVIIGLGIASAWYLYSKPRSLTKASTEKMALPLPDKPSIAVMPFVNMSGDPEQEYFSDGLTEEIITALSKSRYLFVIARGSSFKYKGKPIDVRQVSEDLGVQYVLEGSVRRSGETVRISAQLIDATRGFHVWAEGYDLPLGEILTIQYEIAFKIMKTLLVKLQPGQLGGPTGRGTANLDAFLKAMDGREQVLLYTKAANARARKLYEEVIALDPSYARGYTGLAISHAAEVWLGTSTNPKESLSRAIAFAEKASSLDESDGAVQAALAYLYSMTRQYDKAIAQAERALSLDPNSYSVISDCGIVFAYSGKPHEALSLLARAARLNPSVAQPFVLSSMAYRIVGRYEEAYGEAKKGVARNPKSHMIQVALAATCALTGRDEEAHSAAAEVVKLHPEFTVERYTKALPFKDTSQIQLMADALRKAGLK
jgi:TolB-like protein